VPATHARDGIEYDRWRILQLAPHFSSALLLRLRSLGFARGHRWEFERLPPPRGASPDRPPVWHRTAMRSVILLDWVAKTVPEREGGNRTAVAAERHLPDPARASVAAIPRSSWFRTTSLRSSLRFWRVSKTAPRRYGLVVPADGGRIRCL